MKQKRAKNFFTGAEREKISEAVAAAELHTAGEIATMVVDSSDRYQEAEILGAILMAGSVALLVAIITQYVTVWTYIPLVCILFLPCRYLFGRQMLLKLPFVGRARIDEAVRERAIRAFFEKGLYKTRDETGVLIFISLLERKVWILGDRGINAKIPADFWLTFAGEVASGIKENQACEALCSVIGKCGAELAKHFPRKADDWNELPNEVLTETPRR